MRTMIPSVLILVLWGTSPSLAQLPLEIQADLHLLRAEQAIGESDPARALVELDKILLLQKEHELDLPDEFHFRYAQAADWAGMPEQALEAVVRYLTAAGREGRHYEEALQLLNQVQDAIEASNEPQEASNDPAPPPQEASQVPPAAQMGAGETTEGQEQKQALLTTTAPTEARTMPESETAPEGAREAVDSIPALDINPEPPSNRTRSQAATQSASCNEWAKDRYWKRTTAANVRACLEAGADPNVRKGKWPPLHRAAVNTKYPDVIKALVDAGADLEARGNGSLSGDNLTPLHRAAEWGYPGAVKGLVDAGADLEARNGLGYTPLHMAANTTYTTKKLEILLAAGANPNAQSRKGHRPMDFAKRKAAKRLLAAAGGRKRTQDTGGGAGWGALIGTATAVGVGTVSGASTEAILAGVEAVAASQQAATGGSRPNSVQNPVGTAVSTAVGSCEIPGYPRPAGGVANLGLSWCPASVDFQVRAFALQAAGAQCAIATGSSSTPEQIQARRREISAACGRLSVLGASNCQCPPGLGGTRSSNYSRSIDPENERREQLARQQEEARQAAEREMQARQEEARQAAQREHLRIEANNAAVLNSNCSCIGIEDDGEYTCLDGFVQSRNATKPLCDIKR